MLGTDITHALIVVITGFICGLYQGYKRRKYQAEIEMYSKLVANIIEYDIMYDFQNLPKLGLSQEVIKHYVIEKHKKYGGSITITREDNSIIKGSSES